VKWLGRSRATLLSHYTGESVSDCGHFVGGRSSWLDDRHVELITSTDVGSSENLSHQSVLKGRGFSRAVQSCIKVGGFSP
jgi:hypothetical protein